MLKYIAALLLIFAGQALGNPVTLPQNDESIQGEGLRLLDLESFSMEYYRIKNFRDNYSPFNDKSGENWQDGGAADFDLTMVGWNQYRLYWTSRAHMEDTMNQVRHVGWEFTVGLDLDKLDFFWYHHSQHILEDKVDDRFPLTNLYGVKVNFYKRK